MFISNNLTAASIGITKSYLLARVQLAEELLLSLTEHFTFLEPQDPVINELCVVRKRQSPSIEALQLLNDL